MRDNSETIWIILFIAIYCILSFFFIKHQLTKRKQQKEQAQQVEKQRAQKEKERLDKLHIQAMQKTQERAESVANCETLAGFLAERQKLHERVLLNVAHYDYIVLFRKDRTPENRNRQIIWQSLQIVLESKNEKTVLSRLNVIGNNVQQSRDFPIDEHDFRILTTHFYVQQIEVLQEKIAGYKTQSAKNKAHLKIKTWMEQGLNDPLVYHHVLAELSQSLSQ